MDTTTTTALFKPIKYVRYGKRKENNILMCLCHTTLLFNMIQTDVQYKWA